MKFHAEIDGYRVQWREGAVLSARIWPTDRMVALPFMPIATLAEGRTVLELRVTAVIAAHYSGQLVKARQAREVAMSAKGDRGGEPKPLSSI